MVVFKARMAERLLIMSCPPAKIGGRDRINMLPAKDLSMGFAVEFGLPCARVSIPLFPNSATALSWFFFHFYSLFCGVGFHFKASAQCAPFALF